LFFELPTASKNNGPLNKQADCRGSFPGTAAKKSSKLFIAGTHEAVVGKRTASAVAIDIEIIEILSTIVFSLLDVAPLIG
jgi:hypothetical protein